MHLGIRFIREGGTMRAKDEHKRAQAPNPFICWSSHHPQERCTEPVREGFSSHGGETPTHTTSLPSYPQAEIASLGFWAQNSWRWAAACLQKLSENTSCPSWKPGTCGAVHPPA